jgi:hypothetical protein
MPLVQQAQTLFLVLLPQLAVVMAVEVVLAEMEALAAVAVQGLMLEVRELLGKVLPVEQVMRHQLLLLRLVAAAEVALSV